MAFGCQMDDTIDLLILHQLVESVEVANIHLHELVVWLILNVPEISQVACIGKLIEVDNVVLRVLVYKKADYMRADEAGTTSDYYVSFHFIQRVVSYER